MIERLRRVTNGLYRGSAPSPHDVMWLKDNLGIKKIVSLDQQSGEKIDRPCKLLGIDHVKAYINHNRMSLMRVLNQDIKKLLLDGGPTYLHCHAGKDRTGLLAAMFKCMYMGEDPEKAIEEAKSLGFGVGIQPQIKHLYEDIIRSCKPAQDTNSADIVSNEREYKGDNRDSFLDESRQDSFAPHLDHTRQNPADAVYNYINDQGGTRENYPRDKSIREHNSEEDASGKEGEDGAIPQVGTFNNDAGGRGFGPTENYGGFFYD